MSTITVLSNQYFDLLFHQDLKLVHHIYKPAMGSEQIKELLSAGTELMEKHGATKWLSDNRALTTAFSDEAAQWVNNVWLPRTIKAGWKHWAMVVPQSVISQIDHIKYVESFHNTGVWVTVYTDPEAAMTWIKSV